MEQDKPFVIPKKYLQKMYRIFDVLFFDREKAEAVEDGKESVKDVYVGISNDGIELERNGISVEYFGSWVYSNEKDAMEAIEEYNNA